MKKIPTLFKRNPDNMKEVLPEINPGCEWVFISPRLSGKSVATRKYDGTCCLYKNESLWKRREVKPGQTPPAGFVLADRDPITGKTVGWIEVDPENPSDRYHMEALYNADKTGIDLSSGTYELIGPKIQGNPERVDSHYLLKHSDAEVFNYCPRSFEGLRQMLSTIDIEGLVFHHPDGRMAKIKKRDFGLKR